MKPRHRLAVLLLVPFAFGAAGAEQQPAPAPSPSASPTPSPRQTPSPSPTPPQSPTGDNPADSKTPALSNRLFSSDTSSFDVKMPLGRFAIVDRKRSLVTEFIEKGRFACRDKEAIATAIVPAMKPTTATSSIVDSQYKGSLSVFVVDADVTKDDREELIVTDIATADLANSCQLSRSAIFDAARKLPGAEGLDVIWVSGATLSNLNLRKYSKVSGGVHGGGSWLSIDADGYKGSDKIDSVPIFALRGYIVHVPNAVERARFSAASTRPFSTLRDLGLANYSVVRSKPTMPR